MVLGLKGLKLIRIIVLHYVLILVSSILKIWIFSEIWTWFSKIESKPYSIHFVVFAIKKKEKLVIFILAFFTTASVEILHYFLTLGAKLSNLWLRCLCCWLWLVKCDILDLYDIIWKRNLHFMNYQKQIIL